MAAPSSLPPPLAGEGKRERAVTSSRERRGRRQEAPDTHAPPPAALSSLDRATHRRLGCPPRDPPQGQATPRTTCSSAASRRFDETADRDAGTAAAEAAARRAGAARARRLRRAALGRAPERIRAALGRAPRLADRLHRLGRHRDRADGPRRGLRRRPLHAAGRASRSIRAVVRGRARSSTTPPADWLARHLPAGDRLGYDPWLHAATRGELSEGRRGRGGATLVAGRATTRSTRSGPTARRRRRAGRAASTSSPARAPRTSSRGSRAELADEQADAAVLTDAARRSPGSSTSAAATSRTRRCRSPSPS